MSTDSDEPSKRPKRPKSSKRRKSKQYEVGYCRPPMETRWKKGCPSPNPNGRRRKPKPTTPDDIVNEVSQATLPITDNGKRVDVTRFEALVLTLFAAALKGDRPAQRQVLQMRRRYAPARPAQDQDDAETVFTLRDEAEPRPDARASAIKPPRRPTKAKLQREGRRDIFNRVAARSVDVVDGKTRRKMSFEEALWNSLYADALKDDKRAQRLINTFVDAIAPSGIERRTDDDIYDASMVFTLYIGDKNIITGDEERD